ncbi:hypothetical protein CRM22_010027 [Opisthorchis felineus]|uniref:Msx2-interacting protein n=2 Tax=Opisthorchis felineus TaxID=147828 RepID=A0A4S2L2Y7_OPIFE|nr:hypothetical protein CRM22_010027 [Opisthorchis felineus]
MIQSSIVHPCGQRSASISAASSSSTSEAEERTQPSCSHRLSDSNEMSECTEPNASSTAYSCRYLADQRGLLIRRLSLRSSDTNLREGLFHEFKKHGKITSVIIRGQAEERYCILTFKRSEDAARALEASRGKVFFGTSISVSLHDGIESEDPDLCPPEHALDEYHPKATKTLFVGNLCSSTITQEELKNTFRGYGEIIEIDIKIQASQPGTSYAFVQFNDIKSVVRALSDQDSIRVGNKVVKLGFGKSQPTNVVWLDNLPPVTEAFLARQFGRYGHLTHVVLDRKSSRALLYFDTVEMAQRALNETRNRAIVGRRVQVDFAGYECQVAFMRRLGSQENLGQAYDDYRERLQELLALWPSYGLPLLGRQRYLTEMAKDNHDSESDDYGAPCHRRSTKRASSKKHSGTDHQSSRVGLLDLPRDRAYHKGMSSATSSSSTGRRSNTLVKEFVLETPLSPISNRFGSKKSRHHMDQSLANKALDDSETSRRYLLSHAPSPYRDSNWRTHRSSELTTRANHASSRQNPVHSEVRVNSHYLDETDIVSSDSLSPDDGTDSVPLRGGTSASQRLSNSCKSVILRSSGTRRSLARSDHSRVNRSHRRNSPSFEGLSSSLKHLDDPESGSSSPVNVHPRGLSRHRQTTSSSSSPPRPFLRTGASVASTRYRSREDGKGSTSRAVFPSQRCTRSQVTDPCASAANSFVGRDFLNTAGSKHTAISDHTTLTGSKQSPGRNARVNSSDESGASRLAKFCQLADSADESHDTLTKLEQERAKLLRELSLLNNEVVVGTKPKLAVFPNRKRDADDVFAINVQTSKLRRTESSKGNSESGSEELQTLSSSDGVLASRNFDQYVHASSSALVTPLSDVATGHSLKLKVPAVRVSHRDRSESTELASLTGAERTSPFSESGQCDTADVRAATHDQAESLKPSTSLPATDGFSQSIVTSSPRLIMPPKPTSPLTCLSPPGSPLAIDRMQLLSFDSEKTRAMVPWTSELPQPPNMKPIAVSCNAPNYSNRDPRLVAHVTQVDGDIPPPPPPPLPPPPPPPPPENLKIPLWVDTSGRPDLSVLPVSSRTEAATAVSMESVLNDSERDTSACSLDERIRLLDAQLMKSGKVRPAVDYSKFRIRRKAEPNLAASDRPTTSSSSSGYGNSTPNSLNTAVPEVTGSPAGFAAYSDRGHFYDGSIPSLPGICTGVTSVSPLDNLQTSPLIRPADTSEFVKSMLSSKPSPSVPLVDQPSGPTLDSSTCLRTAHNRYTAVTISNPSPLKSVADAIGSASVASTSPCLANRTFSASSACQYLPPSGAIGHNLPAGTQPVGVATRLPLISQAVEGSSHTVDTEVAPPLKSILKNDLTSPGYPAIGLEAANKSIVTELRPSLYLNIPDVKEARDERSAGLSLTKISVHQTNPIKSEVPSSTSSPRFSHCESQKLVLSAKTKTTSTSKQASNTVPPRSSKTDVLRPTLDDSIFRTSFAKTERKREKLKRARQADATSKVIPKSGNSGTCNQPQISNGSPRAVATHTENTQTSFPEGKACRQERTLFFQKHVRRVQSNHHKTAKALEDKPVPAKRIPNANVNLKSASVHTKKSGIEQKGRPTDSDGSDWEPGSCSLEKAGSVILGETETGYESMYDKIKRRASKGTGKLMDPLSNRNSNQSGGRIVTKCSKKRDASRSSVSVRESVNDSDTDECLSDTSFSEVKPKPARVHRRQVGSTNLKTADRLQKKNSTCQKKGQKKRADDNSENPLSNSSKGGKPQSRGTLNLQDSVGRRGSGRGRVKRVAKPTHHNSPPSPDFPSSSSLPPKRRRCIVENQSRSNNSLFKPADSRPPKHKTKSEPSSVSERQPRSLVRRVFASSDSESSFSSSSSESEGRSKSNTVLKSVVPPLTPSPASRSSDSPPGSGSCSPDDLGADAAVRHTFSAFLSPASHNSEEKKVEVSSRSAENVNRSTVARVSDVTNPTSSTLPLTDTGSSSDQTGSLNSKRDPSEWNIFTSLTNHSTPKRELPSVVTTSMAVSVGSTDDSSHKQPLESDDELPSLEKHDEDDSARLCSDSIELNDNDSLLGRANGRSTDDDLPPPVVSALDDPSPPRIYSEDHQNSVQPDVIEEVIYDSMEVHVSPSEQQTGSSRSQPLEKCGSSPPLPVSSTLSEPRTTAIMTPLSQCDMDVVVSSTTTSSSTHPLSDPQLSASSSIANVAPLGPLSLHSSVFTPITMLTSASQPDEMPTVGQSVLVTVPRAAPGVTFSSQGLTLVPTSCSAPQIATPATPRHVTLILPATSVSLNTSVLSIQNPITTTVYTTPTLVYNTTISNSPVCVLPTPNTMASVYIKRGDQDSSTGVGASNPSVNTKAVELTSSGSVVISTPLEQSAYAGASGNTMLDPSDYTSYVQRVIERVKQEKDEESMQQREKSKRSKKIPPAIISVPPTSASSISFHTPLTTVSLTPCVAVSPITPLLPIAPMPVASKLASVSQSSDGGGTVSAARKAVDSKIIIKPDPAEAPLTSVNCEPLPRSANMTNGQEACVRLKLDASEQNNQEDQTSNTVDEVIDAVASGHFDESDYLQKLAVGTLDQPLLQRHPVISSPGQLVSLSSLHAVGEQSSALVNSIDVVVSKSPLLCSDRTVKSPLANGNLMTPDVLTSTTPPRVFTPMHVLTLVATGGSSINQSGSDSTAISPGLISQASNLPGISVSSQSVNHAATQSLASAISSSSASETVAPPSSSSHRIDHLAAQFANYPLTKYFYSLLAQQQMETSPNSLSSEPTTVSQAESSVSTGSLHNTLKSLTVTPSSNSNDTSEFFAAVATMAAMASPPRTGISGSSETSIVNTTRTDLPTARSFSIRPWSSETQDYPVGWRGRLSLKNEEVFVHMHYLSGNQGLLKDCMGVISEQNSSPSEQDVSTLPLLRIVQRMRLDPSQLDGVQRKLRQANDFCMCLTLAATPPMTPESSAVGETIRMNQVLCDNFIKYMVDKCAAGIVNVCNPFTNQNLYVIHIFPPCDFARCQLEGTSPALHRQLTQTSTPYLLVVITTV